MNFNFKYLNVSITQSVKKGIILGVDIEIRKKNLINIPTINIFKHTWLFSDLLPTYKPNIIVIQCSIVKLVNILLFTAL